MSQNEPTRGTSKGFRLHIGIFGRRNVGKSSLLNAITRQQVSIVSEIAGTTTDPVEKPMELSPLGPVLFVDTAGVDDAGALGGLRVQKTRQILTRTDLGVLVSDGAWGGFEREIVAELGKREIPVVIVFNKSDLASPDPAALAELRARGLRFVETVATRGVGVPEFRQALIDGAVREADEPQVILRDLVGPGETCVMVMPIDREAPKGRVKMLQVQCLRDLLDGDAISVVVQDSMLAPALGNLNTPPRLVVTDAQVFARVAGITPPEVMLTSFSILFSRLKGDLREQALGAAAIATLQPGDQVLIAESCTHHPVEDDIGRVKIPRWLNHAVGGELQYTVVQGNDFPEDVSSYKLVVHCGACMWNRRQMLERIRECRRQGVPITNYGVLIAAVHGMLERALQPFPEVLAAYQEGRVKPEDVHAFA
jgi:[FeFe] hydrogenase H-cluster maturation GTPase HydF